MPAIVPSIPNARVAAREKPGLLPFADWLVEIDVPDIRLAGIASEATAVARENVRLRVSSACFRRVAMKTFAAHLEASA